MAVCSNAPEVAEEPSSCRNVVFDFFPTYQGTSSVGQMHAGPEWRHARPTDEGGGRGCLWRPHALLSQKLGLDWCHKREQHFTHRDEAMPHCLSSACTLSGDAVDAVAGCFSGRIPRRSQRRGPENANAGAGRIAADGLWSSKIKRPAAGRQISAGGESRLGWFSDQRLLGSLACSTTHFFLTAATFARQVVPSRQGPDGHGDVRGPCAWDVARKRASSARPADAP